MTNEPEQITDTAPPSEQASRAADSPPAGMLPARGHRRYGIERGAMRIVATCGVVAIATAVGAILVSQDVAGWIVGLVVGVVSVLLSALLWSSREL